MALLFVPFALLPSHVGSVMFGFLLAVSVVAMLRLLAIRDWRLYSDRLPLRRSSRDPAGHDQPAARAARRRALALSRPVAAGGAAPGGDHRLEALPCPARGVAAVHAEVACRGGRVALAVVSRSPPGRRSALPGSPTTATSCRSSRPGRRRRASRSCRSVSSPASARTGRTRRGGRRRARCSSRRSWSRGVPRQPRRLHVVHAGDRSGARASPIVWNHYFALLLIPLAIVAPRLQPDLAAPARALARARPELPPLPADRRRRRRSGVHAGWAIGSPGAIRGPFGRNGPHTNG